MPTYRPTSTTWLNLQMSCMRYTYVQGLHCRHHGTGGVVPSCTAKLCSSEGAQCNFICSLMLCIQYKAPMEYQSLTSQQRIACRLSFCFMVSATLPGSSSNARSRFYTSCARVRCFTLRTPQSRCKVVDQTGQLLGFSNCPFVRFVRWRPSQDRGPGMATMHGYMRVCTCRRVAVLS
jgi:hypothetical protein